jgi:hypothetical protein
MLLPGHAMLKRHSPFGHAAGLVMITIVLYRSFGRVMTHLSPDAKAS